jgi:hypothetical protein
MAIKFNPLTGNFDFTGSGGGGGGASYIDGEVQNFSALPTANPPAIDSAYLVREPESPLASTFALPPPEHAQLTGLTRAFCRMSSTTRISCCMTTATAPKI